MNVTFLVHDRCFLLLFFHPHNHKWIFQILFLMYNMDINIIQFNIRIRVFEFCWVLDEKGTKYLVRVILIFFFDISKGACIHRLIY